MGELERDEHPHVFISYSRRDSERVSEIAERLRESGFSVWIDTAAIEGASRWSTQIVSAIRNCRVFVLVASKSSFASDNVAKELSIASECKKPILPVYIEAAEIPDSMRYQLAGIQHETLFGAKAEIGYGDILSALRRHLDEVVARPQTPAEPQATAGARRTRTRALVAVVALLALVGAGFAARQLLPGADAKESEPAAASVALLIELPARVSAVLSARVELRSAAGDAVLCSHATNGKRAVLFGAADVSATRLGDGEIAHAPPCTVAAGDVVLANVIAVHADTGADVERDGRPLVLATARFTVEARPLHSVSLEEVP